MRHLIAKLSLIAVLATTFSTHSSAEEPSTLVGEWKVTSAIMDGKPLDAMNFDGMRWVIGEDSLEVIPGRNTPAGLAGKPPRKCTYGVDNAKSPAYFDWTVRDGDRKLMINAVYELKGDVLRVCFAPLGQPRPDGFETKGKKCAAYEFRRSPKDSADD